MEVESNSTYAEPMEVQAAKVEFAEVEVEPMDADATVSELMKIEGFDAVDAEHMEAIPLDQSSLWRLNP